MNSHALTITAGTARSTAALLDLHAHWLLRIGFAIVFLFHGIGKLAGPAAFAEMMQLPLFVVLLVALAEVGGGLAILAGGVLGRDWLTLSAMQPPVRERREAGDGMAPAFFVVHRSRFCFSRCFGEPLVTGNGTVCLRPCRYRCLRNLWRPP